MNHRPTVAHTEVTPRPVEARPRRLLSRCTYRLVFCLLTWLAV